MLPLCSSQNGSLTSVPLLPLPIFPNLAHFILFYDYSRPLPWNLTQASLIFLLPNCLHPQALSLHYFLNNTTCTTKLRNHTQTIYGECSCFCIFMSCFCILLPEAQPLLQTPPRVQSLQPCLPCPFAAYHLSYWKDVSQALQRNRTNKIYLESRLILRNWPMIMTTEKSQALQLASWVLRESWWCS